MRLFIISIIISSTFLVQAQTIINGTIVNEDGEPLSYCKVGIDKTSIGTLSSEEGTFSISIPVKYESDSLKVSFVGYEDLFISIESSIPKEDQMFTLIEKDYDLDAVIVSVGDEYIDGKDKTNTARNTNFSIPNVENKNLGSEIGRLFKIDKPVELEKMSVFVDYNDYEEVKLRLNVYSVHDKRPKENILKEDIYVSFGKTTGEWKTIDLSDYDIILSQNVIITLEWIESSEEGKVFRLPIIIPSIGSTHYYRFGSQGEWKKFGSMSTAMTIEGTYVND